LSVWNFQCFPKEGAKRDRQCLGRVEGNSLKNPNQQTKKTNRKITVLGLLWTQMGIVDNLRAI